MVIFLTPVCRADSKNIDRALNIHPLIQRRLGDARTHAGPRRQMDDLVKFDGGKQLRDRGGIREVAINKFEGQGERLDVAQVGAL